jgi:hypothetical protein
MSKILISGDCHFRFELPYASALEDGRKGEWADVKKTIHTTAEGCDAVVFLGDQLNLRHNHSSVIREFIDFLKGFGDKEIHLIVGNHERYSTSTALDFLDRMEHPNWFIHSNPNVTTVAGKSAMMIPYMTPALLGVETKEEGLSTLEGMFPTTADLAFGHHASSGGKSQGVLVELFNEIVLNKEVMEKRFGHTFYGHIHQKQKLSPSVIGAGSILTQEIGEHEKSIWTWEDGVVSEIPLPVRGIYKTIWEERDAKEVIPSNSIVKCYVTNRETPLDEVKEFLKFFDASMIVEQYPSERTKTHFEEGVLDFGVDNLLKLYSEAKQISHEDIKSGFELINE